MRDGKKKAKRTHLRLRKPLEHIGDAEAGNYRVVLSSKNGAVVTEREDVLTLHPLLRWSKKKKKKGVELNKGCKRTAA